MAITEKMGQYAQLRAAGLTTAQAAAQTGLSRTSAWRNEQSGPVQAEIARLQAKRLFDEALPLAVDCIVGLLRDPKAPAGARVQAAKLTFDRTLGDTDAQGREPHEMTGEELARAIAELEAVAAGRARDITSESDVIDAETPDLFG